MKSFASYLVTMLLCVVASAQEETITINAQDEVVTIILEEVQESSGIKLAYDYGDLSTRKASVQVKDASPEVFLSELLQDIPYNYRLVGKTWVLFFEESTKAIDVPPSKMLFEWSGLVVDQNTREPLPYATIRLPFEGLGSSTNEDGRFSFDSFPSDTSTIEVSFIGYAAKWIALSPEFVASGDPIELHHDFSILPVADIFGKETQLMESSNVVGLTTLNAEQLGVLPSLGESDPIRSIQLLPGINGTSDQSANLHIRGGRSDENLVLFDGFTLYHLDHFYGVFGAINQDAVKNIRLYKGWFPAKFGGRTSSVIEITGKEGNYLRTRAKASLNLTSFSASVETPILKEKAAFIISARRSFTDVIFSPLYQQLFNNLYNGSITQPGQDEVNSFEDSAPDFHFYDVTTKVTYHPTNKDVVQLSGYLAQDNLIIEYDARFPQFDEEISYRDDSRWGNRGGGIRWGHDWDSGWYTNLNVTSSSYTSSLFARDAIYEIPFDLRDTTFSEQASRLEEHALKLSAQRKVEGHQIEFGGAYTVNQVNFNFAASDEEEVNWSSRSPILALYAQDEFTTWFDIDVNAGVRMSQFQSTNTVYTEPRLALSKKLWFGFSTSVAFGRFYQMIRKVRNQNLYLNTPDYWAISDLDQVPVGRSDQILGQLAWEKRSFRFQVEGYYRWLEGTLEDPLSFRNNANLNANSFLTGSGEAWGVEAMIQKTEGPHSGWISATVGRVNYDLVQLEQESLFPSHDQLFETKCTYIWRMPKWKVSGTFVYGSGKPYSPILGTYSVDLPDGGSQRIIVPGEFNSGRLEPYHRLDLAVQYSLKFKKAYGEIGLSAYNVYGRKNVRSREYFVASQVSNPQEFTVGSRDVVSLIFVPSIKLTLGF